MATPVVTLLRDRYVRGGSPENVTVVPLAEVLSLGYRTDVHFQQGRTPKGTRITSSTPCTLVVIAFDVDGLNHQATPEWRAATRKAIGATLAVHPDGFGYETRNGFRLLWALPTPVEITVPSDDAREWAKQYTIAVAYLERCFGLVCDPSCSDVGRLFRAPHATRDADHGIEGGMYNGDASDVGPFAFEASEEDHARARELSPRLFDGAHVPRSCDDSDGSTDKTGERDCIDPDEAGPLFKLLKDRGSILHGHSPNAFVIRCPNRSSHTTGVDGDGSTLLYLPTQPGGDGCVHCLHAGCSQLTPDRWRALLGAAQIQSREVRIANTVVALNGDSAEVVLRFEPNDGLGPLPAVWLRVRSSSRRWDLLFEAADLETPDGGDKKAVFRQCNGLRGAVLRIEVDETPGRVSKIRRIFPADEAAA